MLGEDVGEGSGTWPIHEVGRNADLFPDNAGKLLKASSSLVFGSAHIHSNGRDTKAHLLFGFRFFPKGYNPTVRYARRGLGNGVDIDIGDMATYTDVACSIRPLLVQIGKPWWCALLRRALLKTHRLSGL